MYESDEWYVQYGPNVKRKPNTKNEQYQTLANNPEDNWDVNPSASDNESYKLEVEQLEEMKD